VRGHQARVIRRRARLDYVLQCNGPSRIDQRLAIARARVRLAEAALSRDRNNPVLAAALRGRRAERDAVRRAMERRA
jgi:hypothetical protein